MLIARLQSPVFYNERNALAKYLTQQGSRFAARALRLHAKRMILPGNARAALTDFYELALDAIRTDFYRPLQTWCRMQLGDGPGQRSQLELIRTACTTLETECELTLPRFAPLLGDIRFALRRIARGLQTGQTEANTSFADDAIDIALDNALMSLDACDERLGEHARILGDWSGRMAEAALDCPAFGEFVHRAAILADIGKVTTPRHILRVQRPRSIAENIIYEQHAHAGWEIVSHIAVLAEFAAVVRHHHEWVDGTGYPDGLSGEMIPLAARIIAVADGFIHSLPPGTQGGRDFNAAYQALCAASGSRYDPVVLGYLDNILKFGRSSDSDG